VLAEELNDLKQRRAAMRAANRALAKQEKNMKKRRGGAAVVAAGGGDGAESLLCEKIPGIVAVYARVTLGGGGAAVVAAGGGDGAESLLREKIPGIVAVYARVTFTGHGAPPPNLPAGAAAGVAGEGLDCLFAFCVCGALGRPGANDVEEADAISSESDRGEGARVDVVLSVLLMAEVCSKSVLIGGGAADGDGEED
ncbi:unnamed protein product, partial [Durusdinium trenchii]